MQISCPACETIVDLEKMGGTQTVFACPNCNTRVDIDSLVSGVLVSQTGFGETQTVAYTNETLESGSYVGKFKILHEVGRGGFGSVYAAKDEKLDRIVALKIPKPGEESLLNADVFLREAQMAAAVRDANIVVVHEIGRGADIPYICTDFIDGVTLKSYHREKDLTLEDICRLVIRIARSLDKAHNQGVIHRDLKPANILIDKEGTPFISDFGLAKRVQSTDEEGTDRSSHEKVEIAGTPAYMSPEQAYGAADLDRRTDVYSLGVILYELLTRERPFHGSTATIIESVLQEEPPPPRRRNERIPRVLEAITLRAMAKSRNDRFATTGELADDLERFLKGEPTLTCPLSRGQWIGYVCRKNRVWIGVAVLVLLAGGISYRLSTYFNPAETIVVDNTKPIATARVQIDSIPQRANVAIVPIDPLLRTPSRDRLIQPSELTPTVVDLPAGDYIIEFYIPGLGAQEVRRTVTEDKVDGEEVFELGAVRLVPTDLDKLVFVKGNDVLVSDDPTGRESKDYHIDDFYIQPHEVTCQDFERVMGGLPSALRSQPEFAVADFPVTGFDYRDALIYAERMGMRLPDFYEFYYVATNGCSTSVPWGTAKPEDDCWKIAPVMSYKKDQTKPAFTDQPVFGLYSNVPEVTASTIISEVAVNLAQKANNIDIIRELRNTVVVTGTPGLNGQVIPPLESQYFECVSKSRLQRMAPVGFRCVKNKTPRFIRLGANE